jgi:predicted Rossmann fold nucleotide-binding protein DprA/Smf involved in DNA uptake
VSIPQVASSQLPSPDTQAVLLLCGRFGRSRDGVTPLSDSEYNHVAVWLHRQGLRPADLLEEEGRQKVLAEGPPLPAQRLSELLERGVALALAVEGWTNKGLWVLSRSDDRYPQRLKGRGKRSQAPPVLYGAGDPVLLSGGGLAIVGSREASEEALDLARSVARACAEQEIQVVSGGARGVDNEAMIAALASGGSAVGMLANDLARTATRGKYRSAIQDGTLALISPYDPGSGFNVGHAMRRNRYIYNLADFGLVASSSSGSGGTWQGAIDAIKAREPVFVWAGGQEVPEGNRQLIERGALPFPERPWKNLRDELTKAHFSSRAAEPFQEKLIDEDPRATSERPLDDPETGHEPPPLPATAYEAVLPVMLHHLREPQSSKKVAELLDVGSRQAQTWLTKALEEKMVAKRTRPVRYVVADAGDDGRDGQSS